MQLVTSVTMLVCCNTVSVSHPPHVYTGVSIYVLTRPTSPGSRPEHQSQLNFAYIEIKKVAFINTTIASKPH